MKKKTPKEKLTPNKNFNRCFYDFNVACWTLSFISSLDTHISVHFFLPFGF